MPFLLCAVDKFGYFKGLIESKAYNARHAEQELKQKISRLGMKPYKFMFKVSDGKSKYGEVKVIRNGK